MNFRYSQFNDLLVPNFWADFCGAATTCGIFCYVCVTLCVCVCYIMCVCYVMCVFRYVCVLCYVCVLHCVLSPTLVYSLDFIGIVFKYMTAKVTFFM